MTTHIAIIGGGPAGLMAAERVSAAGARVTLFERMPSVGRKLLMAGRGGLNLTHSEPFDAFAARYGAAREQLLPMLEAFTPADLIAWAEGLGQPTFVGSSGRVFPKAMKASPLLRAWLARLEAQGVTFRTRAAWRGWSEDGALLINDARIEADATILALGGASWAKLGSDGSWAPLLAARGVKLAPFRAANSGFRVRWSDMFRDRFAGQPLKTIALSFGGESVRGEAMISAAGIEGGAIYALSARLRDAIERDGEAVLKVDLRPDLTRDQIAWKLSRPPRGESTSTVLRKALNLAPITVNLLREAHGVSLPPQPDRLADLIKAAPITLIAPQPIDRAISTAGGVSFESVDETLMLRDLPGVFVAGEMLDWEAPTGGYLLQACFASGAWAARGALSWSARAFPSS